MIKICHMTSAHPWNDIRIFVKECQSLVSAEYEVYLVCEGIDHEENGVHIVGCGEIPESRKERMRRFAKKVYERALTLDCDVYHFHDPELLPYGVKLKKLGKKVIFDCHEDVPGQIMDKYWIPVIFRNLIAFCYEQYETCCVKKFDAVVAATPHIAEKFIVRCSKVISVNNYPKLDDIKLHDNTFDQREPIICYAGAISEIRGEKIMVEAMDKVKGYLFLAGPKDGEISLYSENDNVKYLGIITREQVNELYGKSRVGILLYQPAANHYESQPIKMFEYMAAGLPFVASNFPYWKSIVEKNGCGICVDPTNVDAVSEACQYLLNNPDIAQKMGRCGYEAVIAQYNWKNEEAKLLGLYMEL